MSAQLKMGFKLAQKLNMTPQLQQSIKLLTLPLTELEQAVRSELLENPVLEEIQETAEDQPTEALQNKEESRTATKAHNEVTNWLEFTNSTAMPVTRYDHQKQSGASVVNWENVVSTEQSLADHLMWQIQMSGFSNEQKAHLTLLVDHLDENGYLQTSLQDIAKESNMNITHLQSALKTLHTMDPSGVGARNLQECLLIQARHSQEDTTNLVTLITKHLPNLEHKNFKLIAKAMNLQEEEVMDLYKIINAMEPKPGRQFVSQPTQYITPDVYITKDADGYKVSLNEDGLPHLKIASIYQNMLKGLEQGQSNAIDSTQNYLRHKMNSALWLIRALNQRQKTIFEVTSAIVCHQKDFLDKGPMGIKPLILQQIADEVGVHQSTVSRITTNKYAHTPQGIYELKYFFNMGIPTENGDYVTGEQIKFQIQSYIQNEDKKHPLSDIALGECLLKKLNVRLGRRTITRYRELLKIPAPNQRQS